MSPGLRLLMTADTVGGVWSYAIELSRTLAARGVRVGLATLGKLPTQDQWRDAAAVPGLRLFPSDFRCEWMDDPWSDLEAAGEWLRDLEAAFRPDIVHLNSYSHAHRFRAPVLVVGHSCVLSWWEAVRKEPPPRRFDRYRRSVVRGIRSAARVVAPTRTMLASLERHYGPLPPAGVVFNGRSSRDFRPRPEDPDSRDPVVFGCGRLWDAAKNLAALNVAAPELPWPVEVAGSLRHPDGGEHAAPRVRCLGPLPSREVARRMSRASVCAHPARYEPFGLVPLEAALAGCALVLGDIPTLREIWRDCAVYVDPDRPDELVGAIRRLADSPPLRRALARRAHRRALRLSPERMADRYMTLYRGMRRSSRGDGARLRPLGSPEPARRRPTLEAPAANGWTGGRR